MARLTADNYFSTEMSQRYFSVSQYKTFLDCPARAMAEIRGEYKQPMTTALLVGSYVDAYFEGTLEKFKKAREAKKNCSKNTAMEYAVFDYVIKVVDTLETVERD